MGGARFKFLYMIFYANKKTSLPTIIQFKFPNQNQNIRFQRSKAFNCPLRLVSARTFFLWRVDARDHKRLLLTTFSCLKTCIELPAFQGLQRRWLAVQILGCSALLGEQIYLGLTHDTRKIPQLFCLEKTTEFTIRLFPHRQVVLQAVLLCHMTIT